MAEALPRYSGNLLKDVRGAWRTKSLFFETSLATRREDQEPIYTLKDEDYTVDGVTYKSLHNIYMRIADPSEYNFAMEAFGSYKHWKVLQKATWFKPYLQEWRDELAAKIRSDAIKAMVRIVEEEGSKGTSAARYLAEEGWSKGQGKGRPSKEKIEREANKILKIHEEVDEDIERMAHKLN